jgi:hypothetical protein
VTIVHVAEADSSSSRIRDGHDRGEARVRADTDDDSGWFERRPTGEATGPSPSDAFGNDVDSVPVRRWHRPVVGSGRVGKPPDAVATGRRDPSPPVGADRRSEMLRFARRPPMGNLEKIRRETKIPGMWVHTRICVRKLRH